MLFISFRLVRYVDSLNNNVLTNYFSEDFVALQIKKKSIVLFKPVKKKMIFGALIINVCRI